MRRFVLLDRDGTIIVEKHYLDDPEGVELLEGAADGLRRMLRLGLGLLVVTNQSGVGRGLFDEARLESIHERLLARLADEGVRLDGIYACVHHPDVGCRCRKPAPGLVERAAAEQRFRPEECFVVGDMESDVRLGQMLGASTFLVRTGYGAGVAARGDVRPDFVVEDLREVAETLERLVPRDPSRDG
jgi:histidinol-phosphate phosphatase family protein